MAAGCDGGSDDSPSATAGTGSSVAGSTTGVAGSATGVAGSATGVAGSTTGTGGSGSAGAPVNTGGLAEGVPLTPTDGWVDAASNTLGIQGAMFAYADDTSLMGMTSDFTAAKACIKGTAAKVDLKCTPAMGMDCYGTYWGAAIGLNLNQKIDATTMMGADPAPFDATAIKGFAFELSGMTVPTSIRFKVENSTGEFCTPAAKPVLLGANSFLFSDLITECWKAGGMTAETGKTTLIKIAWQVVTNSSSAVPFDFCVDQVRALQ